MSTPPRGAGGRFRKRRHGGKVRRRHNPLNPKRHAAARRRSGRRWMWKRRHRRHNPPAMGSVVQRAMDIGLNGAGAIITKEALPLIARQIPSVPIPTSGVTGSLAKVAVGLALEFGGGAALGARIGRCLGNGAATAIILDLWDEYVRPAIGLQAYLDNGLSSYVPGPRPMNAAPMIGQYDTGEFDELSGAGDTPSRLDPDYRLS